MALFYSRDVGAGAALRAADTGVIVAAFASWREKHEVARRKLDAGLRPAEHSAELLTRDRRAIPAYERYAVRVRLL
jgi:hypothetical protein